MEHEFSYIRIGTAYYKTVQKPLASGDCMAMLLPWSVECIKQDHGKSYLSDIPKHDGFCFVPSHLDYRRIIGNFYNRYYPFAHEAKAGKPEKTLAYLSHIFGEQLELGLDYLKILLEMPMQVLPILCLVSSERNTGKTTFLNLMKAVFGDNMTINTNEDFRSNFNAEWAHKLIIGVDETFLERKEDSERLKNLSTATFYKAEAKGFDRQEIEFFGKFILCSNNEESFVQVDAGETRYWIRKIPVLVKDEPTLLKALKAEIPFLVAYLKDRKLSTHKQTRMWFTAKQIATAALIRVIQQNRNKLEVEMSGAMLAIADEKEITELKFCITDMQHWLNRKGFRTHDFGSIKRILQQSWKLRPAGNSNTYNQYRISSDGSIYESVQKGRYYMMELDAILKLNEE
ncbi:MAG TPA: primase-helicase family protein [Hanamia sp.]|jgi:hypothetical protein